MTAREVGLLARSLTSVLYLQDAVLGLIEDARTDVPGHPSAQRPADGLVARRDGSLVAYDWNFHLTAISTDPVVAKEFERSLVVSALLVLGDRLAAEDYFDRAPVLEMVRHLRNAVAHRNVFEIRDLHSLAMWPAHTRDAACRSPHGTTFEVTAACHGARVLFDFMGPGDVVDVVASVGTHLLRQ